MSKLNTRLKGAAGLGLAGLLSGCGYIGGMIGATAPYYSDPRAGASAAAFGQAVAAREAAEAGRSETNTTIYVGPPIAQQQATVKNSEPEDYIFAYTSFEDAGEKYRSLKEFKGIGMTYFTTGQTLGFCLYNNSKAGDIRFILKDEKGKVIRDVTDKNYGRGRARARDPPDDLRNGKYTAEWWRDGILIGKTRVEVRWEGND